MLRRNSHYYAGGAGESPGPGRDRVSRRHLCDVLRNHDRALVEPQTRCTGDAGTRGDDASATAGGAYDARIERRVYRLARRVGDRRGRNDVLSRTHRERGLLTDGDRAPLGGGVGEAHRLSPEAWRLG